MIDAELAYAFTLGMVAAVNPCGFAMLPAYLSYFLGLDGAPQDSRASAPRAIGVALSVTAGFVVVFGVIGLAITQLSLSIFDALPWVTMIIGAGLVVLGIAMLRGFQLSLRLPKVQMGTGGRELSSMFLFGISYALVSLSCTIGLFLPVIAPTVRSNNLVAGVAGFVMYAVGMGLVLSAITVALALAKGGLVRNLRRAQPHINKVSGALLVLAGTYLAYYGYWAVRVLDDPTNPPPSGPVDLVTGLSNDIRHWITDIGPERIGVVLGAAVAIAVVLAVGLRRPTPRAPES
ncbi:cytochrome c biogenesis CcdA family protein [Actinomarinicola tropica]|uniref:Cytochrome c biogenesis protein CcdA n=1 Tax=Actinomarinicola tropica TaxID=2789776 RepID=A0A5Q2RIQ6_9ACTN|nr:cytochrome c biogenesis CcdA family protein [Actinomarinicola tropica]QGG93720.1 cytochrome c biogenesis protein CcdA [Actinomarinicola tropica]